MADSPVAQQANGQAQATTAPHYPPFVELATAVGSAEHSGVNVKLFSMSFLGLNLASGVNSILCDRLIKAQRNLYLACLKDKQVPEVTELDFGLWCWLGRPLDTAATDLKSIQPPLGLSDRKSPNSRHHSGSAIDINLNNNPFVAGRTGGAVYGETHDTFPNEIVKDLAKLTEAELDAYKQSRPPTPKEEQKPLDPALQGRITKAKMDFWTANIWRPAIEIYDRAMDLFNGTRADVHDVATDPNRFADAQKNFDRFDELHAALKQYFAMGFDTNAGHKLRSLKDFDTIFTDSAAAGFFSPNAKDLAGGPLSVTIATNHDGVIKDFFDRIQKDHEIIKRVMVNGSCQIQADKSILVPSARDPCKGFLNFRQVVVVELVREQKLRWGCCMFGAGANSSGDMMHFDLGTHFGTGGAPPPNLNEQPGT